MSLRSQVDFIYCELQLFEKKVRDLQVYNPKYQAEINRLKFQCHQLHADAVNVENLIQTSRIHPEQPRAEIQKRIYLLTHEVGYLKESFSSYVRFDRTTPTTSDLFSSPSDAGSPGAGSPMGRSPVAPSSSSGYGSQSQQSLSQSQQSLSQSSSSSQESMNSQGSSSSSSSSYSNYGGSGYYTNNNHNHNPPRINNNIYYFHPQPYIAAAAPAPVRPPLRQQQFQHQQNPFSFGRRNYYY